MRGKNGMRFFNHAFHVSSCFSIPPWIFDVFNSSIDFLRIVPSVDTFTHLEQGKLGGKLTVRGPLESWDCRCGKIHKVQYLTYEAVGKQPIQKRRILFHY